MVTKQPNETTGGSSSFCEMIIFRNESHGELKEFVWEYLRQLLGGKNTVKSQSTQDKLFSSTTNEQTLNHLRSLCFLY